MSWLSLPAVTRVAAATFVMVGGLIHLWLWQDGYRNIPKIGPSFVANVAVSAVVAVALLVFARGRSGFGVSLLAVGFTAASLVALVMSRTTGLLGFTETAWTHRAVQATTAEVGALVALGLLILSRSRQAAGRLIPIRVNDGI